MSGAGPQAPLGGRLARGARAGALAYGVLRRAVPDRPEAVVLADGDRAAALCAGARSRGRAGRACGTSSPDCRSTAYRADCSPTRSIWASYLRSLTSRRSRPSSCSLIGYPLAYGIARAPRRVQPVLMIGIVLPFLTAFLIRIYAWMNILQRDGPAERHAARARPRFASRRSGSSTDTADLYRHGLHLPAVHGAAALRQPGEDGRHAAGGRERSRLPALEGVLARHRAVVLAWRGRRLPAVLHPDRGRVRHSRSARRLGFD